MEMEKLIKEKQKIIKKRIAFYTQTYIQTFGKTPKQLEKIENKYFKEKHKPDDFQKIFGMGLLQYEKIKKDIDKKVENLYGLDNINKLINKERNNIIPNKKSKKIINLIPLIAYNKDKEIFGLFKKINKLNCIQKLVVLKKLKEYGQTINIRLVLLYFKLYPSDVNILREFLI